VYPATAAEAGAGAGLYTGYEGYCYIAVVVAAVAATPPAALA